jgi:hypothetical protein
MRLTKKKKKKVHGYSNLGNMISASIIAYCVSLDGGTVGHTSTNASFCRRSNVDMSDLVKDRRKKASDICLLLKTVFSGRYLDAV